MAWIDNPVIGFTEEDARCLHHPHDDVLIVSIRVGDYNTYWVLVDNESSADILYYPAFQQMRIEREQLVPTNALLVGFGGTRVYPFGAVTLPLTVNDYSQQNTKDVSFLVVDCSSTYNAILGHPTLNLMIKFPIEYGGSSSSAWVLYCYVGDGWSFTNNVYKIATNGGKTHRRARWGTPW